MKKIISLSKVFGFLLIILPFICLPVLTSAGTFFECVDKNGNKLLTDNPYDEKKCKPVDEYKDLTPEEKKEYDRKKAEERELEKYSQPREQYSNKRKMDQSCKRECSMDKSSCEDDCSRGVDKQRQGWQISSCKSDCMYAYQGCLETCKK